MRTSNSIYSSCYSQGVSQSHLHFDRGSKAGRGVGKLSVEKKKGFKCALSGHCWHGKGGQHAGSTAQCDWSGVRIWLSLAGPKLEARKKMHEAVIHQGLAIQGRLLQKLLFSFLDYCQR